MEIDRRKTIAGLGGMLAAQGMDSEAKAEALEGYLSDQLDMSVFSKLGAPSADSQVYDSATIFLHIERTHTSADRYADDISTGSPHSH